jgi:hypothetical protein
MDPSQKNSAIWTVPSSATSLMFRLSATDLSRVFSVAYSPEFTLEGVVNEEHADENTALRDGSVIRYPGSDAVYLIHGSTRRVFINGSAYHTWYASFADVVLVDIDTLNKYTFGGLVLPKAETVLVKVQSIAKVYYLDKNPDNVFSPRLRWITEENVARELFGTSWADYVIDVEPTFFTKFTEGDVLDEASDVVVDITEMKKREELL